jgi:hypothetical protein
MSSADKAVLRDFLNGEPVASVPDDAAPIGEGFAAMRRWATAIFEQQGGKATSPEVGEVVLDERAVRDSQAHYKRMPSAVANAFASVKDVIEKGRVILVENTANRPKTESVFISAPVRIGSTDDIVTVLVHRDANTQRMYLHSAWTKESLLAERFNKSGAGADRLGRSGASGEGGIYSIIQDALNFNEEPSGDASDAALFSVSQYEDLTPAQMDALRAVGGLREPKSFRQWAREKLSNLGLKLTQGMVDQYAPLKVLDEHAYILARMSHGTDGALEAALLYGTPRVTGDTLRVDQSTGGFLKILSKLDGEQDRFMMWMAAHRAEQLTQEGREFLFSPAQIALLKQLDQGTMHDGSARAPRFQQVLQEYNAFQDAILDIAETRGLIDPASRKVWANGFYVPFYRNMEDGVSGPSIGSGLVNQEAFKRLKGSKRQLNDLLENVLLNMAHLLDASAKNLAARAALTAALGAGVARRRQWAHGRGAGRPHTRTSGPERSVAAGASGGCDAGDQRVTLLHEMTVMNRRPRLPCDWH